MIASKSKHSLLNAALTRNTLSIVYLTIRYIIEPIIRLIPAIILYTKGYRL